MCNDQALFTQRCIDCRAEFPTGNIKADQCHACQMKERARYAAEYADSDSGGRRWRNEMRDGAQRRVMEKLKKGA